MITRPPRRPRFTIVTATASHDRTDECMLSWHATSGISPIGEVAVAQRSGVHMTPTIGPVVTATVPDYLGVVPAFRLGLDLALQITDPTGVIACLHDDVLIEEENWDAKVMTFFNQHPEVGLVGFGGGTGLGSDDIYQSPYDPMQLARQDFVSNMRDAESHGRRSTVPVRVACLDGFSQIGRVAYWRGISEKLWRHGSAYAANSDRFVHNGAGPLHVLDNAGVIHHAYDAYLGADAIRRGWEVWMLPIACHHYGGQTAVGDAGYQQWANQKTFLANGDHAFWLTAHHTVYERLKGVLPLRIKQP